MMRRGRVSDQAGSAIPLTLLLGTTLIVMPVMVLVLTLPTSGAASRRRARRSTHRRPGTRDGRQLGRRDFCRR